VWRKAERPGGLTEYPNAVKAVQPHGWTGPGWGIREIFFFAARRDQGRTMPDSSDTADKLLNTKKIASDAAAANLIRMQHLIDELTYTETELEQFFQLVPDMFAVVSTDLTIHKANRNWQKILDYSPTQLAKSSLIFLVHPDDRDKVYDLAQQQRTHGVRQLIIRLQRRDGEYVPTVWSCTRHVNSVWYLSARPLPAVCFECKTRPTPLTDRKSK
jgi:PAS domain S-box-containing protein